MEIANTKRKVCIPTWAATAPTADTKRKAGLDSYCPTQITYKLLLITASGFVFITVTPFFYLQRAICSFLVPFVFRSLTVLSSFAMFVSHRGRLCNL
jgi:hypothetical protein